MFQHRPSRDKRRARKPGVGTFPALPVQQLAEAGLGSFAESSPEGFCKGEEYEEFLEDDGGCFFLLGVLGKHDRVLGRAIHSEGIGRNGQTRPSVAR